MPVNYLGGKMHKWW